MQLSLSPDQRRMHGYNLGCTTQSFPVGGIQEKMRWQGGARDPQHAPPGWFFASLTHREGCHGRAARNRGVWVF